MSENNNQQQKSQDLIFWESLTQTQRTLVIVGVIVIVLAIIVFIAIYAINYFNKPDRNADEEALLIVRNTIAHLRTLQIL